MSYTHCKLTQATQYSILAALFMVPLSSAAMNVFIGIAMLLWLVLLVTRKITLPCGLVPFSCALLFVVFALGIIYSDASWQEISATMKKTLRFLLIPMVISMFSESQWRRRALMAFLSSMTLMFIVLISTRYSLKDHIFTSLFLACSSFVTAHLALQYHKIPTIKYLLIIISLILIWFLLVVNIGRSGQVLFFLLAGLFCWQRCSNIKQKVLGITALLLVLAAASYLPTAMQQRLQKVQQHASAYLTENTTKTMRTSTGTRLEFAKNTWKIFLEQPFIGWGTGSFKAQYAISTSTQGVSNPHNQYLLHMLQLGSVGLLTLLLLFASILKASVKLPNMERWCCQGLVLAIAAGCMANSWLHDITSAHFFFIGVGVCLGTCAKHK
ncbi:MAG: hypothetical protein COC15_01530 [Legionellales bacterium]|nr:MAG: hypothetical protein COC15_01530 [Legionellales bacterium]